MTLTIDAVTFSYRPERPLLADVSLVVEGGQTCCVLGPNGSGKTTLIRCIVGLVRPSSGKVTIAGVEVGVCPAPTLARQVAYVPQSIETAFPVTCFEMVLTGRTPYIRFGGMPTSNDRAVAWECLEAVKIEHLAQRQFNEVSGGERQLVTIARALCQETPVIVLDEPTSALDFGNQVRVLGIVCDLADSGKTLLMTSHAPNQALEEADTVVLLKDGKVLAAGEPDAVITGPMLSDLYGVPVSVLETGGYAHPRRVCVAEVSGSTPRRKHR